ncbi:putative rhomboid protease [Arthrobotrys musiformis]|uniref:rhomboid protease n=1 Tax=Arthrobotrys musiformis TaxID=47236 RepID=A0AAV9WIR7_9PEZI
MLPNLDNVPDRIASTVRRLPILTRGLLGLTVVLFILGRVVEVNPVLELDNQAFGITQLHRLNTYPFVHRGWIHLIIDLLAVTYPLSRFEREKGTLHTLLMVVGPFSTFPAVGYTVIDKFFWGGLGVYYGMSVFIVMFAAMDATRVYKYKPYYWIGGYRVPSWAPVVGGVILLEVFLGGGTGWVVHILGMAVGWAYAAEYLKLLEPPEKVLKFVETKLRFLVSRVPFYVALDGRDSAGHTLVLPTFAEGEGDVRGGVEMAGLRMNPRNSPPVVPAGGSNFGGAGRTLGS